MYESIGRIDALWRYPVKSMQGEAISEAALTERGICGDRAYALLDCTTGLIASAKHPRKWRILLECQAQYLAEPVVGQPLPPIAIRLPDGTQIKSSDAQIDQILSDLCGRAVRLVTEIDGERLREANRTPLDALDPEQLIRQEPLALGAPAGTFFDYAALHILTTTTISQLEQYYPAGQFAIQRLRPNMLVEPATRAVDFVEHTWLGQHLMSGSAKLYALDPCPRCVITTLAQGALPHDPQILRTISQHSAATSVTLAPGVVFAAVAGMYARVQQAGHVRCGDALLRVA